MVKVSICLPVYNQEKMAPEAIWSALKQDYPDKEILVIDDCSTDNTFEYLKGGFGTTIRLIRNEENLGYAKNMEECIRQAQGEYIVFLCGDDKFTYPKVISDIVKIFEECPTVGIVDRWYYQYMDGYPGAVVEVREPNTIISSVNPSGMGIRRAAIKSIAGCVIPNSIYIEFPYIIKTIMLNHWRAATLRYDTIAVRIHKKNQALRQSYYKGSLIQNWYDLIGDSKVLWDFKSNYISVKNRAGQKALMNDIRINIKLEPRILLSPLFWFFATLAIVTPRRVLIELSDFYRHRISRRWCRIIERSGT